VRSGAEVVCEECGLVRCSSLSSSFTRGKAPRVEQELNVWEMEEVTQLIGRADLLVGDEAREFGQRLTERIKPIGDFKPEWLEAAAEEFSRKLRSLIEEGAIRSERLETEKVVLHWYDFPDRVRYPIRSDFISTIFRRKNEEVGAKSLRHLIIKEMGLDEADYSRYRGWNDRMKQREYLKIRTGSLKKFCEQFAISYEEVEKAAPELPREIPIQRLMGVWTQLLNEGFLYYHKDHGIEAEYKNRDPMLVNCLKEPMENMGGRVDLRLKDGVVIARASGWSPEILEALKFPWGGKRTVLNPELPKLIRENFDLWKQHFSFTMAEEGTFGMWIDGDDRLQFGLSWSRSVDATDRLPWLVNMLEPGKNYARSELMGICGDRMGIVSGYMSDRNNGSKLLVGEFETLKRVHSEEVDPDLWPKPYCAGIYKSKEDRLTATWKMSIARRGQINLFAERYGFPEGTWKQKVFERWYSTYGELREGKLDEEEITRVGEIKSTHSLPVPTWWQRDRIRELGWKIE